MALRKMESAFERFELPHRFQGPIGLIAIAAAPPVVLSLLIPTPLALPVLSLLSFAAACILSMYALSMRAAGGAGVSAIWNIAYVFTLTWIVAGMMSNPRHVFDWFDNLSMVP